ncbi:MAG: hypothetical protein K8W52_18885 [Deltaproteobacteria bacterium]|nr:hypothetical protein [Deltaproteobacteria bacterium]
MSYRDDVEALFQRAHYLQAEVDRLHARMRGEQVEPLPPMEPAIEIDLVVDGELVVAPPRHLPKPATSGRAVWLPVVTQAPPVRAELSEEALAMLDSVRHAGTAGELGLLVARLTETENDLVMRVLELLASDDFTPAGVKRNTAIFDQLVLALRERLARPG